MGASGPASARPRQAHLGPGIALPVIWFIWAHVTPFINEQIELDDPVVAGEVMNLGDGELTFVPAVGWNVESGQRVTDQVVQPPPQTVELSSDLVVYTASSAPWDGTAEELLDRMIDINDRKGVLLANDERGRRDIEMPMASRASWPGWSAKTPECSSQPSSSRPRRPPSASRSK